MIILIDMPNDLTPFAGRATLVKGPLDDLKDQLVYSIWDEENPQSLIRLVGSKMRERMLSLPVEYRTDTEHDLRRVFKPDATLAQVRLLLWLEYTTAVQTNAKRMVMDNCHRGICTQEGFYYQIEHDMHLRFLLVPPQNYTTRLYEALDYSLMNMRSILEYSDYDIKGKLNMKLLEMKLKIMMYLDARVHGPMKQKLEIEQKTAHAHIHATLQPPTQGSINASNFSIQQALSSGDMKMLDARLAELEKKEQDFKKGGPDAQRARLMSDASMKHQSLEDIPIVHRLISEEEATYRNSFRKESSGSSIHESPEDFVEVSATSSERDSSIDSLSVPEDNDGSQTPDSRAEDDRPAGDY